jgi:O-antigen ligase
MPIGTAPTNVFMALTVAAWLLAGGFKQRLSIFQDNYFPWTVVALYGLLLIGALYSTGDLPDITFQLSKYLKLLFLLVAMSLLQEKKWQQWALNAFSLAMSVTLALSLISVLTPLSFVKGTAGGPSDNHIVFKDHIVQNLMMSFFVLLMLVRSQIASDKKFSILYLVAAALAIIDIVFFVQGRTGYISLALNIVIFIVFYAPPKRRLLWLAGSAMIALVCFHFSANLSGRIELAISEFQKQDAKELTSVGQRVEFTKKSLQLIKERPLFGSGTGSYAKEFCRVAISAEWCEAGRHHPHNQFMAFGVQLGLLGILSYLAFLGTALQQARRFSLPEKVLCVGLLCTLLTDSILHAPLFLVTETQFFVLMLAIMMNFSPALQAHEQHP